MGSKLLERQEPVDLGRNSSSTLLVADGRYCRLPLHGKFNLQFDEQSDFVCVIGSASVSIDFHFICQDTQTCQISLPLKISAPGGFECCILVLFFWLSIDCVNHVNYSRMR